MFDDLTALIRTWQIAADHHDEAAEEINSEASPRDADEASMHAEAARVYRQCAEDLHRLMNRALS